MPVGELEDVEKILFNRYLSDGFSLERRVSFNKNIFYIHFSSFSNISFSNKTHLNFSVYPEICEAYINNIFFSIRGQGFGKKVIVGLEDSLSLCGINKIELYSKESAMGFWENLGYKNYPRSYVYFKELVNK